MEAEKIRINDVVYLKESDVDKFYTRKDNVVVDRMVLESVLMKMNPSELVKFMTSVAENKLKTVGYAELEDMLQDYETFEINRLLMISNVGRMTHL
ncbi:hypothetical protein NDS46_30400 (plasmid) [Paenibacillus thiaminolyticus]|uniref:hypothetical protein n=1 Tax=Paenibacillus thiaminolyticus TaxID=49283 RepID=UPI00232BBD59|nr:hypothetical protein [Paenibacillus thiaminolyticus]WCF11660.1 hypothetical protein NDS46_30400 [Paenibacillus thiaminolyticus]